MSEVEQCAIEMLRAALAVARDNVRAAQAERDAARAKLQEISLGAGLTNFSTPVENIRRMAVGVVVENERLRKRIAELEAQNTWYGVPADVQERT